MAHLGSQAHEESSLHSARIKPEYHFVGPKSPLQKTQQNIALLEGFSHREICNFRSDLPEQNLPKSNYHNWSKDVVGVWWQDTDGISI